MSSFRLALIEFINKRKKEIQERMQEEEKEKLILSTEDPTTIGILDGVDDTFKIIKKFNKYYIQVYLLDDLKWSYLTYHPRIVLGISDREFFNLLTEKFNGEVGEYIADIWFKNIEDAQIAIKEFKPYYDSYYLPRIIMRRLDSYDSGGYPTIL